MSIAETKRLVLERLTADDLEAVLQMGQDPELMRFLGGPLDRTRARELIDRQLRRYDQFGVGFWAARLRESGELAGLVGLLVHELDGARAVEIAYRIDRRFWGQGLAPEAAAACRDYGFRELGEPRLISMIDPDNHASRRVAEKLGLAFERRIQWEGETLCLYSVSSPHCTK